MKRMERVGVGKKNWARVKQERRARIATVTLLVRI